MNSNTGNINTFVNDINYELFNAEQLDWHKKAKEFVSKLSIEEIISSDRENLFRHDLFERACTAGFGALPFIKNYGGEGSDYVSFCLVNEIFARHCMPVMSSLGVHVLCQEPIYTFGTEEQKDIYLSKCAKGKLLAAFALTEPAAGSDTAAIETTAKLSGNDYILNGNKVFITSGSVANLFIVFARLQEGITAFIVERNFKGLSIGQKFDMLGMRGYGTCEIVFNNCIVPKNNILSEPGMGRKVALSSLAKGRVTIAAQAIGWARGAIDGLNKCMQANSLVSKRIDDYKIFDLLVNIEAASALAYQAARAIDQGKSNVVLASMAKLRATDIAMKAADQALDLAGCNGEKSEYLIERIYRDAKAGQIYEGTNQIQKLLIARDIFST
jgi:acyl-CoA dehydrogenase